MALPTSVTALFILFLDLLKKTVETRAGGLKNGAFTAAALHWLCGLPCRNSERAPSRWLFAVNRRRAFALPFVELAAHRDHPSALCVGCPRLAGGFIFLNLTHSSQPSATR